MQDDPTATGGSASLSDDGGALGNPDTPPAEPPKQDDPPADPPKQDDPSADPPKKDDPPAEPPKQDEEEYELELSEDSPLTEADLDEIAAEAERLNLSKEDAQKLITIKESTYKKAVADYNKKISDHNKAEKQKLMSDPDFAGDKWKPAMESVAAAIEAFGDDDLVALLKTSAGNNLALAKFLKKVGDTIKPESPNDAKGSQLGKQNDVSEAERLKKLYPSMF